MRNYEITFIINPTLPGDAHKEVANGYVEWLKANGCEITHIGDMGLRGLAYPIQKCHSGFYYCIEVSSPDGVFINKIELAFRRNESILRFLTIALDKYGVQYNEDFRAGKIGGKRKKAIAEEAAKAAAAKEQETLNLESQIEA
ncbi:MAG: hypothetical protein RI894_1026 [Bacteroidota bacterium]